MKKHVSLLLNIGQAVLSIAITILAVSGAGPMAIAGCAVALFGLVGFSIADSIATTKAVRSLAQNMTRLAAGDYAASLTSTHAEGASDIAALGRTADVALNRLVDELGFARGVLNGMATPCVVVDAREVLRFTNKNLLHLLQHDGAPEDFYGQNVAYFFYGDASRPTVLGAALREQRDITKEVELVGRKGAKRNIRIDASPLYDLHGQLMGSLCVYADLTELRAQEAHLLDINARIARTSEQANGIGRQLAQAARQLTGLVDTSRNGAAQQSARMAETATAMEEMNATVMEVARNATQAADTSAQARTHAENGAQVVGKVVEGIMATQQETLGLKQDMSSLGAQAESIGQIMSVISDIADQTNLLALNAAIEAARAGDAGRGFAVVADEVRKLAEKTMTATKEVGQAIRDIQQGTGNSISAVDKAVRHIDEVAAMAGQSGEALSRIVHLVESASAQVHAIATASGEQSSVSEEISRSIEQVSAISATTATDMGQAAQAVDALASQAQVLSDLIREMQQAG